MLHAGCSYAPAREQRRGLEWYGKASWSEGVLYVVHRHLHTVDFYLRLHFAHKANRDAGKGPQFSKGKWLHCMSGLPNSPFSRKGPLMRCRTRLDIQTSGMAIMWLPAR